MPKTSSGVLFRHASTDNYLNIAIEKSNSWKQVLSAIHTKIAVVALENSDIDLVVTLTANTLLARYGEYAAAISVNTMPLTDSFLEEGAVSFGELANVAAIRVPTLASATSANYNFDQVAERLNSRVCSVIGQLVDRVSIDQLLDLTATIGKEDIRNFKTKVDENKKIRDFERFILSYRWHPTLDHPEVYTKLLQVSTEAVLLLRCIPTGASKFKLVITQKPTGGNSKDLFLSKELSVEQATKAVTKLDLLMKSFWRSRKMLSETKRELAKLGIGKAETAASIIPEASNTSSEE